MAGEEDAFAKVMEMDAAFKEQAKEAVLDPATEATALSEMLQVRRIASDGSLAGGSKHIVQEACVSTLGEGRWCELTQAHEFWRAAGIPATGGAVCKVVEDLDADHLRPTGILQRIKGGNAPACNGLSTLMKYLDGHKAGAGGGQGGGP